MNGIKCFGMFFAACAVAAHGDVVAFKDVALGPKSIPAVPA